MMTVSFRDQRGFSLLEMMLVIAISTFMAYVMFAAMRAGDHQIQTAQVKMAIQESAREGVYRMIQELRMSAPDRIAITGGNTIQFEIPDSTDRVTGSYDINWDGAQTIRYARGGLNGNQIVRTNVTTGQVSIIGNDVTAVTFAGNDAAPEIVTITLSVQRTLINGRVTPATPLQISGQAEIRNA
jgi:prepilin-type N-terminal cleavage/methylation domain-containing protein